MKTLLIVTGPQGSGNHLFSKVLSLHPDVFGWDQLNRKYWIAHDEEPFAKAWLDPSKLRLVEFGQYAVTSISCPVSTNGKVTIPNYDAFIVEAMDLGYKVKFAIIGRDQNILKYQQERVRDTYSLPKFMRMMDKLADIEPVFLSTELLYLYKEYYVRSLSSLLEIPVLADADKLHDILYDDQNAKYFTKIKVQPLDPIVRQVSGLPEAK